MLKKIAWSENSIFNVKLGENLFTLAQMRCNHLMQFFDINSEDGAWSGVDLNAVPELFSIYVAENKLKPILTEKIDDSRVTPNRRPIPKLMLSLRIDGPGEFGADLIELSETYSVDGKKIIKQKLSSREDLDSIHRYELAGMVGDPNKIKGRLLRFFESGVNWDESKCFIFKDIQPPYARNG
ncbi:hypothetical protein L3V59_28915 [Burkholderia aenigmatica]|uniref:hypothetical protein n=1 Tax=Burkholderia aenigmatica TaxID=2015348 RepID=UPI001F466795|nr:hypothetical protein [Burkholderia aenigmatica]UKD13719.1 hypothetical protein L3V59_28915 [Burkholderia aenigmatica]